MRKQLKQWAKRIKADVVTVYLASRDPRVPWYAKAIALATVAYALSPIDLIPDFVPVLGYLDDLIVVPLGIFLTLRAIPTPLLAELRLEASRCTQTRPPASRAGIVLVAAIWAAFGLIAWAIFA